ncbi:hypothetical protein NY78_2488 [Desulfovibrio sp. TomC]|nr:hypothetical protein NY78_2488 [Desulfovibrio sp. TomC]
MAASLDKKFPGVCVIVRLFLSRYSKIGCRDAWLVCVPGFDRVA